MSGRYFRRVGTEIMEISGEGLVLPVVTTQDEAMTTTKEAIRKGICYSCMTRRTGPSPDARRLDLCDRCLNEAVGR